MRGGSSPIYSANKVGGGPSINSDAEWQNLLKSCEHEIKARKMLKEWYRIWEFYFVNSF